MTEVGYFPIRGVIEGFYGTPWSFEQRLDMIRFLRCHHFNAYFYAPKNDPYLRERWQEQHPPEEFRRLGELCEWAGKNEVDFYYCLSPGLNMRYNSEADISRLLAKYRQLHDVGVRRFGLLFDDIPLTLMHREDQAKFSHLAEAHVTVISRLWETLLAWSKENFLVVCPTVYHGLGNEDYLAYVGHHVPAEIPLFWTGRFVCSPALTTDDARRFRHHTGRLPLVWDNYPVNDLMMADELHIGPLLHRDPDLARHTCGFVANAMELAESSKIPLATIGEFLHRPDAYSPEHAWRQAVSELVGEEEVHLFLRFADNVRGSFLNDRESPRLTEALQRFQFHYLYGDRDEAIAELKGFFHEMEQTADYLLKRLSNRKLAAEIRPWLVKYWHVSKTGQAAVSLIAEGSRGRTARAAYAFVQLKRWIRRTNRLPHKVCGHVMNIFLDAVLREVNNRK